MRDGNRIVVSGTTATHAHDHDIAPGNARAQTTYILDKIAATLTALGAGLEDVIRTRTYLTGEEDAEAVSRAHCRVFGTYPPTNTTYVVGKLVGDFRVEIEAEALVADTGET
ncbi:Rid family hydrolase [Tateyamaria sp. ANG-S1]|uniref:Rid family hydrolase n=1 Tax=Tateyamaria sp. ANG-S1 TaxID=1577905 RepID=UPI001F4CBB07|nr:Rid family hydrolase [Tateyamaria sp. ANG-S1]